MLATYPFGEGTPAAASDRLVSAGHSPALSDAAGSLLRPAVASAATIVYPQLGGLTATTASVMVVARVATKDAAGTEEVFTRVVDVRMALKDAVWRVATVATDGSGPPAVASLPPALTDLLADERIELPDSARADIRSGTTDLRVATLLTTLSQRWRLSVAVLATGHPPNVFETNKVSNHTAGRGVDIWAVDGVSVAELGDSPTLRAVVDAALQAGATEIGAPFDTDGAGGKVFTNDVHLDHLHLAFRKA